VAKSNVEMVLSAKDKASSSIKAVSDALGYFVDAQGKVIDKSQQTGSAMSQIGRQMSDLKDALKGLGSTTKAAATVKAARDELSRLEAEVSAAGTSLADYQTKTAALVAQQDALAQATKRAAESAAASNAAVNEQAKVVSGLNTALNKTKQDGQAHETAIASAQTRIEKWSARLDEAQKTLEAVKSGLSGTAAPTKAMAQELGWAESAVSKLTTQLAESETRLERAKTAMAGVAKPTASMAQELDRAGTAVAKTQKELATAQERLQNAQVAMANPAASPAVAQQVTKAQNEVAKLTQKLELAQKAHKEATAAASQNASALAKVSDEAKIAQATMESLKQVQAAQLAELKKQQAAQAAQLQLVKEARKSEVQAEKDGAKAIAAAERQRQALATMATELKQAGVDTQDLAVAEAKLKSELDQTAASIAKLTARQKVLNQLSKAKDTGSTAAFTLPVVDEANVNKALQDLNALGASAEVNEQHLRQLSGAIAAVKTELSGIRSASAAINSFRQQQESVAKARAEMAAYRTALKESSEALKATNAPAAEAVANHERLVGAAVLSRRNLEQERTALKQLEAALNAAGVDTKDLVAAQNLLSLRASFLNSQGRQLTSTYRAEASAIDRLARKTAELNTPTGQAAERSRKLAEALNLVADNSRKSMSTFQRLRGQILSIGAAYIGLYGAVEQFKKAYASTVKLQSVQNRVEFVNNGDLVQSKRDMELLRVTAKALGFDFENLADSYATFLGNAKGSALEGDPARGMFLNFSLGAKAMKLDSESIKGSLRAISQMISKGKITAEDFREQLAERFPAATARLAKALKDKGLIKAIEDLPDFMQNVGISTKALIPFLMDLGNETHDAAIKSADALDSWASRAKNVLDQMRREFMEGGPSEALKSAFRDLEQAMQDPAIQNGMRHLSELVASLIQGAMWLVRHIQLVGAVAKTVFWFGFSRYVIGLVRDLFTLIAKVRQFGDAWKAAISGVGAFGRGMALLGGPIGLTLTGLTLLTAALIGIKAYFNSAGVQAAEFAGKISDLTERINDLSAAEIAKASRDSAKATVDYEKQLSDKDKEIRELRRRQALVNEDQVFNVPDFSAPGGVRKVSAKGQYGDKDAINDQLIDAEAERAGLERTLKRIEALQRLLDQRKQGGTVDNRSPEQIEMDRLRKEYEKAMLEAANGSMTGTSGKDRAAAIAARLDDEMSKVKAKIDELNAQAITDIVQSVDAQLDAVEGQVAAKYEKLIRDLTKAGRTADVALVQELIKIETSATKAEVKAKAAAKAEKAVNDLFATRKDLIDALLIAEKQTGPEAEANAADLRDRLAEVNDQLRYAIEQAILLAEKTGNLKLANDMRAAQTDLPNAENRARLEAARKDIDRQMSLRNNLKQQLQYEQSSDAIGATGLVGVENLKKQIKELDDQLQPTIISARTLAESLGNKEAVAEYNLMLANLHEITPAMRMAAEAAEAFASGAANALVDMADQLGQVLVGAKSLSEGFKGAMQAFAQFAADFLRQIAMMILQAIVLKSLQSSNAFGGLFNAAVKHSGGMVESGPKRAMPSALYANALRYHTGGVVGLKPNEVPAVLQRGEEVLTKDDPRHRQNGGLGGESQPPQVSLKIVNTIDSGEFISQGLSTVIGEQAFLNFFRSRRSTINSMLGRK